MYVVQLLIIVNRKTQDQSFFCMVSYFTSVTSNSNTSTLIFYASQNDFLKIIIYTEMTASPNYHSEKVLIFPQLFATQEISIIAKRSAIALRCSITINTHKPHVRLH